MVLELGSGLPFPLNVTSPAESGGLKSFSFGSGNGHSNTKATMPRCRHMESSMLEMIDLTDNEVKEVLTKINIMLSRYCKGTSFRVIAEEIPRLTPHVFNAQAIARRYGLNYSTDAA